MTSEGYVTGTESAVAPSGAAAGDPPARGGAAAWAPVAALTLGIAALVASEFPAA